MQITCSSGHLDINKWRTCQSGCDQCSAQLDMNEHDTGSDASAAEQQDLDVLWWHCSARCIPPAWRATRARCGPRRGPQAAPHAATSCRGSSHAAAAKHRQRHRLLWCHLGSPRNRKQCRYSSHVMACQCTADITLLDEAFLTCESFFEEVLLPDEGPSRDVNAPCSAGHVRAEVVSSQA